jgi:anti-anti-sigma factor
MGIQEWSENVVLVNLDGEQEATAQIDDAIRYVAEKGNCGVVIDFSDVTVFTSKPLASLMRLRKLLDDRGERLVLCSVDQAIRGIFAVTELDDVFEMVDTRFDALANVDVLPAATAENLRCRIPLDSG